MHSTRHELQKGVADADLATIERLLEFGGPELAAGYTDDGWTYLHLAPTAEVAEFLLAHGAEINAPNRHKVFGPGGSALHAATYTNRGDVVRLLIQKGANVKATDDAGWTPLHLAASNGYVEIARLLLEAGADPNMRLADVPERDWANQTALGLLSVEDRTGEGKSTVQRETDDEMRRLLRQHGAS